MKVLFMGTPQFAVAALSELINTHEVVGVITQPDKPKGRGKKLQPSPVKEVAVENNIPVYQPEKIKSPDFIEELRKIEADIFIVVAYGQLLSQEILDMPKFGCVNVHGSLLPKYRGAAPIQWSVINGEEKTGVTIMYMEKGLDTGDMILKEEFPISQSDTYGSVHDKMSLIGARLLIKSLEVIEKDEVSAEKQNDSISTYAPMIDKDTELIDWSKTSNEIRNLIRGLNPMPCAYSILDDVSMKIWTAEFVENEYSGIPGEIVDIDKKKGFIVKTGDSALLISEIQAKGGKKMSAADYMRGHAVNIGEKFSNI